MVLIKKFIIITMFYYLQLIDVIAINYLIDNFVAIN